MSVLERHSNVDRLSFWIGSPPGSGQLSDMSIAIDALVKFDISSRTFRRQLASGLIHSKKNDVMFVFSPPLPKYLRETP